MKKKTKVIVSSAMSIAVCASLIAGSTLAIFSSESKTDIAITSGKVDVSASIEQSSLELFSYTEQEDGSYASTKQSDKTFAIGGTASFEESGDLTLTNIVPGDKAVFDIHITNASSIAVKYQLQASSSGDAGLFKALNITFGEEELVDSAFVGGTSRSVWTPWSTEEGKEKTLKVSVELPYETDSKIVDGNAEETIQGKTCGLQFTVSAVQGNARTEDPEAGKLEIHTIDEFVAFAKNAATESYEDKTITLRTDIDMSQLPASVAYAFVPMAAETWAPIGTEEHPFMGIFDGTGHTIYNLHVENENASLFGYVKGATIENLKFVDVVREEEAGGIVVGHVVTGEEKTTITNVTVSLAEESTMEDGALNGGLVGEVGSDADLTITDSTVADAAGETTAEWDESGKVVHRIATAQELIDLVNSGADLSHDKVLLTADLDFTDAVPGGKAYMIKDCQFEIDGKDGDTVHTITGLKYALFLYVKGGSYLHDFTIDLDVNLENPAGNKLARGAIAENVVPSDESSEVTVENVVIKGEAINMRAAFFDESGEKGTKGTLNFINCRSEVNMTSTGDGEITKLAAFLNLPDAWDVNFTDCVNAGTVTYNTTIVSNAVMGGFVSYAQGDGNNTLTFTRCTNAGDVVMNYNSYGFSDPDIGGFIGKVQRSTHVKFIDCANTATVSCSYTSETISIGGFVGQSTGGSITFEGKNVNGSYTGEGDTMVADADKGEIVVSAAGGDVRAGGFVGFPGGAAITVNGTLVNAGNVNVTQREGSSSKFIAYAGGLFGHTTPAVTFAEDCAFYNLGNVTVTVAHEADSVVYLGGVVGYVSGNTYTLNTATGYNAGTLTATGAATMYEGSFAGCVNTSTGLTDDALSAFSDKAEIDKKIGHTA